MAVYTCTTTPRLKRIILFTVIPGSYGNFSSFLTCVGLVTPVRCVKFSPGGKLLGACGDSSVIALFDVVSGEQVAKLTGHSSLVFSISWNSIGDHLLSGYV
jgi:WD40 repeat protein